MKLVVGLIITLAAVASQAQTPVCTNDQIRREARDFLAVSDVKGSTVEFVQNCLQEALKKEAEINRNIQTPRTTRARVLNILAEIKHEELGALIKCETTGTPGCMSVNEDSVFSKADEEMLARDADAKNKAVQEERANGSRDW